MSWIKKLIPSIESDRGKRGVPEGLWSKCEACQAMIYTAELEKCDRVCPKCGYHMRLNAIQRLNTFLDAEDRTVLAQGIESHDPLKFKDTKRYKDRLLAAQKSTGENDALQAMAGKLEGLPLVVAAFNFEFMGGSMGSAVGEAFVQAVQHAMNKKIPFVCFSASGGARMQEALISLMQMAKTSAALAKFSKAGLPYISVLTDPTMGGVSASLAMLGDIIIAEPDALIGFAGPRVIQQTVRQTLPEGFQKSEFLLEHGAIDLIIPRAQLRSRIASLLKKLTHESCKETA